MLIDAFHYAHWSLKPRKNSRYPLDKFKKLVDGVGQSFENKLKIVQGDFVPKDKLLLAHSPEYIEGIETGDLQDKAWRELGFDWSESLYKRSNCIVNCTYQAAQSALRNGVAFVLGGGAHHAHADRGSGYCVFNDLVLVPKMLQAEQVLQKVAIFDCDVHQGDGTAALTEEDPSIVTCSIHAESNFPFRKFDSDFEFSLADTVSDLDYITTVKLALHKLLESDTFELLIYVAGADPFVEDCLGRLAISASTLLERDMYVFSTAYELEVPVVVVFGGGYCKPIDKTIECNLATIQAACDIYF